MWDFGVWTDDIVVPQHYLTLERCVQDLRNSLRAFRRLSAVRREAPLTQMKAAPAKRPIGTQMSNSVNGPKFRTMLCVRYVAAKMAPQTGRSRKKPIHKSFVVTGPRRP